MMYLFVIGRILLGGYFVMSGVNHFRHVGMLTGYAQSKGVMMPKESVLLSGLMMLLGGLGIVLGMYIQISVALLVVFLLVATLKMHQFWTVTDPMARMGEQINFMKNMALVGAILMLLSIATPWAAAIM